MIDGHRPFPLPGARARYAPDRPARLTHIDLDLRPDLQRRRIDAVATLDLRVADAPLDVLVLDAVELEVSAVTDAGGTPLAFTVRPRTLEIRFPEALSPNAESRVIITYAVVDPRRGAYFTAPDVAEPDKPVQLWTQSQDEDARYWVPCLDGPDLKQTSAATITVKRGLFALSNGKLVERRDEGDHTIYRYEQTIPHATYLLTLVTGEFSAIDQGRVGEAPVAYYVAPGREADGERAFAATPRMIQAFNERIGVPYPWAQYGQIAVADFIFGGMENTAATTQTDRTLHDERAHLDFSSDPLVSHELAHQWFGDLLTTRDWSNAWLNEGFATYFEAVWAEADLGWDEYLRTTAEFRSEYFEEDGDRYRRAIVENRYRDPIEIFDRHLYQKGGAVLHMLRGILGHDRFWASINRYVRDNAGGSVETLDLVRAIERETGRNLRGFFDQFVLGPGHPELKVSYRYDRERAAAIVEIEQTQTIDAEHPPFVFDLVVGVVADAPSSLARDAGDGPLSGEVRRTLTIREAREAFAMPLEREPALVRVDPGAYTLANVTYALGTEMHVAILTHEPDPIARERAVRALGKDDAKSARSALIATLTNDPFWFVAADAARTIGATRTAWAREALIAARSHAHPKVRRAVADALGNFRDDAVVDALLAMRDDASYFVVAAAAQALGKTRSPRALTVLRDLLATPSWNATIAAGAARGLGELDDIAARDLLLAQVADDRPESLRRATFGALAKFGSRHPELRTPIIDAIDAAIADGTFLVKLAAIGAAETLEDARLLGALDRVGRESDARLRRDAIEAASRIREAGKAPAEIARLREDLDRLREETAQLRQRLDTHSA